MPRSIGSAQSLSFCRLFDHDDAAHERMTGAAQLRALELVAAGVLGCEINGGRVATPLGNLDVRTGSDDAETVSGVVAPQTESQRRPDRRLDLRGRERESLGRHVHHLNLRLTF